MRVELVLLNGERRKLDLPSGSGTVANALARLDDWIRTSDGGWVQKTFIVEVRVGSADDEKTAGSDGEYEALDDAAGQLAEKGLNDDPQAG
jgi:hypothetical protein